jgi:hypothetical protein
LRGGGQISLVEPKLAEALFYYERDVQESTYQKAAAINRNR